MVINAVDLAGVSADVAVITTHRRASKKKVAKGSGAGLSLLRPQLSEKYLII